jgi:hypothetical protein
MKERVFIQTEEYEPYDKWFENNMFPSENGITLFFLDITDRKKWNLK